MKQFDDGAVAEIEREGKHVYGTLALDQHKVYERIPVHVMYLDEEKQADHFRDVIKQLRRRLQRVMSLPRIIT